MLAAWPQTVPLTISLKYIHLYIVTLLQATMLLRLELCIKIQINTEIKLVCISRLDPAL